jgi:hypothetical protein
MIPRMRALLVFAALCSACSGGSPTNPTSPAATPATAMITGHVSATNGGQPLGGLAVDLAAQSVTTDSAGTFRSTVTPAASMRAVLSGSGILPRTVYLAAASSREVAVDAIALGGAFDVNFYQALARNGFESPTLLQPLRRLTRAPLVYVRTVDEAGQAIDATTFATVIDAVWSVGSSWSGGSFGIADVPRGTEDHAGQSGWLTVKWVNPVQAGFCGRSDIGRDGGVIELNYLFGAGCSCNGSKIRPATVRHEIGHAFGFWHTGNASDLMSGLGTSCEQQPSARELYHAAIAYHRPIGNMDPDTDPSSAVNLAPMKAY